MHRMRWLLAVLRSFFHSSLLCTLPFHPFPLTSLLSSLTSSCHLFLGLHLSLVVSKFIYNIFLEILFFSILCTCPNQCNLFNITVSVIVKPTVYVSQTVYTLQMFDPSKMHVWFHFPDSLHTTDVRPLKNACVVSFPRQFTHYKRSTPQKMHMCVSHFSDSLQATNVRLLKNACVSHFSDSLHTTKVRPLKNAHVCVSFLRQFTHYKCSTPRKCMCMFHFSDSLHTTDVRPLKNACVCLISQTVYTLQMFDPSKVHVCVSFLRQFTHYKCSTPLKMHVCVSHDVLACYTKPGG